jgi:hypothetical protein
MIVGGRYEILMIPKYLYSWKRKMYEYRFGEYYFKTKDEFEQINDVNISQKMTS